MSILEKIKSIKFRTLSVDAYELGEGETILIKELSAKAKSKIVLLQEKQKDNVDWDKVNLIALMFSVVDDKGDYEIKTEEDAEKVLNNIPDSLYIRLITSIWELNGNKEEKK